MIRGSSGAGSEPVAFGALLPFLLITFGLAWGILALFIFLPERMTALFHFQLNNPIWPDAQPYDSALFVAVAVLVTWLNRKTMFTREGAVTGVIPRAGRGAAGGG